MNQASMIRLAFAFMTRVKQFPIKHNKVDAPIRYKQRVMAEAERLVATGASVEDVEAYISRYAEEHEAPADAYSIQEVLDYYEYTYDHQDITPDPDNLITPGRFYYHPWLQVSPPPPRVKVHPDGTFEDIYEPFYLEIVDRVTPDDLVAYFYDLMDVDEPLQDPKRHAGAFRSMVDQYGLDLVMYMMGETQVQAIDAGERPPIDPWQIRTYLNESMERLEEKKNIAYMEGVHYVQPKRN